MILQKEQNRNRTSGGLNVADFHVSTTKVETDSIFLCICHHFSIFRFIILQLIFFFLPEPLQVLVFCGRVCIMIFFLLLHSSFYSSSYVSLHFDGRNAEMVTEHYSTGISNFMSLKQHFLHVFQQIKPSPLFFFGK